MANNTNDTRKPNWPQHKNPKSERKAVAPYNFVPLPEKAIYVDPDDLAVQDHYHGLTGYIECRLQSLTPLYTRTAVDPQFFQKWGEKIREMMADNEAREQYAQFFHLADPEVPVIPGSMLRGMTRGLVEMLSYGKVQWVTDAHKFSFRAVAAPKEDPLREPYERILGKYGRNVRAGYVRKIGFRWFIQPAKTPKQLGFRDQDKPYLQVKKASLEPGDIVGLRYFDDPEYQPQYHLVSVKAENRRGNRSSYTFFTVGSRGKQYPYTGVLICSGNMDETGGGNTPRQKYTVVLEADDAQDAIIIDEQAIQDYCDSLTDFQKATPFDPQWGCLIDGNPVFYVVSDNRVLYFGHTPNFRVSMRSSTLQRAVTPLDFLPPALRETAGVDLAEAIFGYVRSHKQPTGKRQACAGRVFFTDATYVAAKEEIWLTDEPITPKILASPKPTTFQHYLVQDTEQGHNPDRRETLAHYGTPAPTETVIRGHKLYWHQRNVTQANIEESQENQVNNWSEETQHTQIRPVNKNVIFTFRVYFENLLSIELGVLLWALGLPVEESGKRYCHKLGMGKPLGMGSVSITPKLVLSRRKDTQTKEGDILKGRYRQLFDGDQWYTPERVIKNHSPYIQAFETFVLDNMDESERKDVQRLAQIKRVALLLKLLEWSPGVMVEQTQYMTIEPDEFSERPVLPDPAGVRER